MNDEHESGRPRHPLAVKARKGIHFFFYSEKVDERIREITFQASGMVIVAGFVLWLIHTFFVGNYYPENTFIPGAP